MQSTEMWKPVVGYEGLYEVSDQGRVRSLDRVIMRSNGSPQRVHARILSPNSNVTGHRWVGVQREGVAVKRYLHRLVLESFIGPCPDGMEGCHNDGDPANNTAENLRWDTRHANIMDSIRHGTDFNRSKTTCPRGHVLEEPNLRAYELRKGYRNCYACSLAYGRCRGRGVPFDSELADKIYSELIA